MKLIHYTNEKFSLEPMTYDQQESIWQAKPNGLWFSIEGDYDWKWWCEAENFNIENLVVSYEIELKEDANILHLKTPEEIIEFTKQYALSTKDWDIEYDRYQLKWDKVKEKYQGIIISPYQWDCRLRLGTSWYYGWDCASGCIWDLECIKEFKLMEINIKAESELEKLQLQSMCEKKK